MSKRSGPTLSQENRCKEEIKENLRKYLACEITKKFKKVCQKNSYNAGIKREAYTKEDMIDELADWAVENEGMKSFKDFCDKFNEPCFASTSSGKRVKRESAESRYQEFMNETMEKQQEFFKDLEKSRQENEERRENQRLENDRNRASINKRDERHHQEQINAMLKENNKIVKKLTDQAEASNKREQERSETWLQYQKDRDEQMRQENKEREERARKDREESENRCLEFQKNTFGLVAQLLEQNNQQNKEQNQAVNKMLEQNQQMVAQNQRMLTLFLQRSLGGNRLQSIENQAENSDNFIPATPNASTPPQEFRDSDENANNEDSGIKAETLN